MSLARYAGTALRVFDAMSDAANGKPVWVYGQSFGTVAALHFAANRPLDWQVLGNVTPAREMLHAHTPRGLRWAARWEARGIPGTLDVSRNAAKSKKRCLFLTSRDDALSPAHVQTAIRKQYAGTAEMCMMDGV